MGVERIIPLPHLVFVTTTSFSAVSPVVQPSAGVEASEGPPEDVDTNRATNTASAGGSLASLSFLVVIPDVESSFGLYRNVVQSSDIDTIAVRTATAAFGSFASPSFLVVSPDVGRFLVLEQVQGFKLVRVITVS
eukprot:gb/GEZJ01004673.1/.p1 GENE.gb/GEZJ01004673.1/~~gb/GEZJ01004673.1/.p1  ORF type:complete len:135 (-),score=11.52 gb/GEZJ01004673.1/:381-785(-)